MITVYKWVGLMFPGNVDGFIVETDGGSGSIDVTMDTESQDAIISYIDYQKGSENEVIFSPSFSEKHIKNGKFYNDSQLVNGNYIQDRSFKLDHSTIIRFPIITSINEDTLKLNISLSPETGDGVVEVYLIPASPYI